MLSNLSISTQNGLSRGLARFSELSPGQRIWGTAWLLSMIALPPVYFLRGYQALPWAVTLGVFFQTGLVVTVLHNAWGIRRTLWTAAVVAALGWLVEAIGSATGLPFGQYHYTAALQPQLGDVPLLIPLAWLMMLPPAWVVAARISGRWRGLAFIGLSGLAMTAWDLFLDPQMVAWGFWEWANPHGYFGIPWLNFAGWFLTATVMTAVVRPRPVPGGALLTVYIITWLLEFGGLLFFWGLPGPAVVGFVGMGSLAVAAIWLRDWKKWKIDGQEFHHHQSRNL